MIVEKCTYPSHALEETRYRFVQSRFRETICVVVQSCAGGSTSREDVARTTSCKLPRDGRQLARLGQVDSRRLSLVHGGITKLYIELYHYRNVGVALRREDRGESRVSRSLAAAERHHNSVAPPRRRTARRTSAKRKPEVGSRRVSVKI